MDEGKRKELFVEFQKHMYDNAVAMKAGNYGLFQVATAKLKNFKPYRIPAHVGRLAREVRTSGRRGHSCSPAETPEEP